uniref:Uncharacterized protein n=1 Tax=Anguilla anguilla TaxID=7936 RepID=A0A0E9XH26_ANGAN
MKTNRTVDVQKQGWPDLKYSIGP